MVVYTKISNIKMEMILTANGNPEYFDPVIDLVDNAPRLKNWKFTAFMQPTKRIDELMKALDDPYIFHEMTLKVSQLTFLPLEYHELSHKLDIVVFLKSYNLYCDTKTLQQVILMIMQDIVCEKSCIKTSISCSWHTRAIASGRSKYQKTGKDCLNYKIFNCF